MGFGNYLRVCKYKFDVNDDKDVAVEDHTQNILSDEDGGIVLLVGILWEFDIGGGIRVSTQNRTFYLKNSKLNLDADDDDKNLEDELEGVISPIVYGVGIISSDHHRSITQLLVSNAAVIYLENDLESGKASNWIPLNIYIVIEIQCLNASCCFKDVHPWSLRDLARFINGLELFQWTASDDGEHGDDKKLCAICLDEFPVNCLLVRMPSCCHVFHEHCINAWLTQKSSCSMCHVYVPPSTCGRSWDKFLLLC